MDSAINELGCLTWQMDRFFLKLVQALVENSNRSHGADFVT